MTITVRSTTTAALLCVLAVMAALPWSSASIAADPLLVREINHYSLGHSIEYLEDKEGTLTFEEIRSGARDGEFRDARTNILNFGFTRSAYWLRFRIDNTFRVTANTNWVLELSFPFVDGATLYSPTVSGEYQAKTFGDRQPFWSRDWRHRNFVFNLGRIPDASTDYYYMRVYGRGALNVPLDLWTPQELAEHTANEQIVIGIYYGVMLAMLLYNLFIYFSTRDVTYLRYVSFLFAFLMLQAVANGHGFQYIWPPYPALANISTPFFIALSGLSAIWFTTAFLEVPQHKPELQPMYRAGMYTNTAALLIALFMPTHYSLPINILIAIATIGILVAGALAILRSGSRPAQFYLAAWSMLLLGCLLKGLALAGVLPQNHFTNYTWQLGSALEVLLLSLGLGDRINVLREERLSALQQAFEFEKIAHTDRLTGLYNRTYFEREFKQHKDYAIRNPNSHFGLFIVDLIGLKQINDVYGHAAGDQAIRMTARILKSLCRQSDVVSRIGGDEYAIICPRLNHFDYEAFVARMEERTAGGTIKYQDGEEVRTIPIHLSIGHGHTSRVSPKEIFEYADKEMYRRKEEFYLTHERYRTVTRPDAV